MPSLRGGAWTWGRAELRRRWRRDVLVGLLVAAVGGAVIATIAGARRTDTAVARFAAEGRADAVVSAEPAVLAAATALPQVERYGLFTFVSLAVIDPPGHLPQDEATSSTISDPGPEEAFLEGVILVDGRIPNRDKPDEIAVDESAARHRNLRVGDEITLRPVSFEDGRPTGRESFQVTVVGVVRTLQDLDSDRVGVAQPTFSATDDLHLTPAFLAEHRDMLEDYSLENFSVADVYLKAGRDDLPAFIDGVRQLSGGEADVDTAPSELTGPVKNARASAHVQAVALLGVGAVLGSAALLLLGQWLRRQTVLDEDRRRVLRALGFTSRDLLTADFVRALAVGVVAAVGAGALAVGLSPFFPMSTARRAEIDPGITVDWPIICLGAAIVLAAVVALHLAAARSPARHQGVWPPDVGPSTGGGGRPRMAGFLSRAGAPVAITTGVRMAFEPGQGASAVPVRSGTGLAIVSVAALTAATVFAVSLDDFVGSPTSQGWNWDAAVTVDPSLGPPDSVLDEHPEIADAAHGNLGTFPAATGNTNLAVLALEPLRGELLPRITAGRPPRGPDEVALGAETLAAFDLDLGETAVLIEGSPPLRVVGQAVLPGGFGYPNLSLGQGAVVTGAGLERIGGTEQETISVLLVRFDAGVDTGHAITRLTEKLGAGTTTGALLPPNVENLRLVRGLPFALASALAAIGMLTVGHVLITTIRRRRRDFAILRALGFSGRQTGAAVVCQAAAIVLIAVLIGLPVGLVIGRWAWTLTVEVIGGSARQVLPLWFLAWIPIGLALASLVAAGPAWRAAHQRPVDALRAD